MAITNYRVQHRSRRSANYSWKLHIFFNILLPFSISAFAISSIENPKLMELLILPGMFIIGSFAVWLIHKYPLHIEGINNYMYQAHAIDHHSFFNYHHMAMENHNDLKSVLVEPKVSVVFSAIYMPMVFFITRYFFGHNLACLVIVGSCLYFMFYELIHTITHLREDHKVFEIKPFRFLREHHRIHHHPKYLNQNFNVAFPLADWVLKTLVTKLK